MKILVSACLLGENCKYNGGNNVDAAMGAAVAKAVGMIRKEDIRCAVLQSGSPTCGVNQIYGGSFPAS